MQKLTRIVLIVILVAIAGGIALLVAWDIPAPSAPVEKVIPNERFSR